MSVIVQDDFESYPLGSHPATWSPTPWDVPPSDGTVIAASPDGIGTQAFSLGELQFTGTAQSSVSHKWIMNLGPGSNLVATGILQCQIGTGGYSSFAVGMNGDHTLWVTMLGVPASHESQYVGSSVTPINYSTWYWVEANVIFGTYIIGPDAFVSVEINLAINGIEEIATGTLLSGVTEASIGGPGRIDRWIFAPGTINGSGIDNILVETGGGAIPPPPATEPATLFQAVVETLETDDPDAVIYQAVVEILQKVDSPVADLKLVKIVNGGTAVPTDWTLTADGPTPLSGAGGVDRTPVDPGVYNISESAGPPGYNGGRITLSGGGTLVGNQLTLGTGDDAVITITNTLCASQSSGLQP